MTRLAPLTLTLAALLLLCGVGEVGARLLFPSAEFGGDRMLARRYHPYRTLRYTSNSGEFDVTSRYNSVGMRDREHAVTPAPGTLRVVVLGDSFMEAKQVEFEQSFPSLLERALSRNRPSEVVNTGRSGFGTIEQHLVLRHFAVERQPDVVVQAFFMNDVYDDLEIATRVEFDDDGVPLRLRPPLIDLRFPRLLADLFRRYQLSTKEKLVEADALGYLEQDPFAIVRKGGVLDGPEHWTRTLRSIEASAELSSELGALYLLVCIPLGQQVDRTLADAVSEAWSLTPAEVVLDPQERLLRFGAEKGIAVLDLRPILAARRDKRLYFTHDGHWTPLAHELAARSTAARIHELLRGPGASAAIRTGYRSPSRASTRQ